MSAFIAADISAGPPARTVKPAPMSLVRSSGKFAATANADAIA
nr:hypothetical protein [uncultured bacterium]